MVVSVTRFSCLLTLSLAPRQADILLPRQHADGGHPRPVQGPLLDLDQFLGGVQTGEGAWGTMGSAGPPPRF